MQTSSPLGDTIYGPPTLRYFAKNRDSNDGSRGFTTCKFHSVCPLEVSIIHVYQPNQIPLGYAPHEKQTHVMSLGCVLLMHFLRTEENMVFPFFVMLDDEMNFVGGNKKLHCIAINIFMPVATKYDMNAIHRDVQIR